MEVHSTYVDGCRVWHGSKVGNGYGQMRVNGKSWLAHRAAYTHFVGEIPEGHDIDHTCHNRACIEVSHLRPVTRKQNLENQRAANKNSATGVRGVHFSSQSQKYVAKVYHNGKNYYAGSFGNVDDAGAAVVALRNKLFTHNDLDRVLEAAL